jgi:FkbM family methyltransferase
MITTTLKRMVHPFTPYYDFSGHYSQYGQDRFIEDIFNHKQGGVFVDIGAYDGITLSNTYHLEKDLHWTGIAVEPNPKFYSLLEKNRTCKTIRCGISESEQVETFVDGDMLSGIPRYYSKIRSPDIPKNITFTAPCMTLENLLKSQNLYEIDYLSIDVEGAEYFILKNFPFENFFIKTISLENAHRLHEFFTIPLFLRKHGFTLRAQLQCDDVYVSTRL